MPAEFGQQAISASRFSITVDGYEIASFSELAGITTEAEPSVPASNQLPGLRQRPTIALKRGLTGDMALWAWHEAVVVGPMNAARKSSELVMFGSDGKSVARFHLENAWPSKLEIGSLKSGAIDALYETVTFQCDRASRVAP